MKWDNKGRSIPTYVNFELRRWFRTGTLTWLGNCLYIYWRCSVFKVAGCNVCSETSTSSQFYPPMQWQIRLLSIPVHQADNLSFTNQPTSKSSPSWTPSKPDAHRVYVACISDYETLRGPGINQTGCRRKHSIFCEVRIFQLWHIRDIPDLSLLWIPAILRLSSHLSSLLQWIIKHSFSLYQVPSHCS
jgi:hypothetical protein